MNSSNCPHDESTPTGSVPLRTGPEIVPIADWAAFGLHGPDNRHGQSVRIWTQASLGQPARALAYAALSECAWRFSSDAPLGTAEPQAALYPLSLMHAGLGASYLNEVFGAAEVRDVDVHDLSLILDSYYLLGDAATAQAAAAQALPLELEIRIASSIAADELREMLLGALGTAPQNGLLRQPTATRLGLTVDGRPIGLGAPGQGTQPDSLADELPDDRSDDSAADLAAAWTWLEVIANPSPPLVTCLEPASAEPGSPPPADGRTEPPSQRSHGRAICHLNQDGTKRIEHRWRDEFGPAYMFLSDEAEGFGGQSLGPDAVTYMAAGLALSFVTQLAHAAATTATSPALCRALVDVHFPFGVLIDPGAANQRLDPLAIQVALAGSTEPAMARALLHRTQRACALQALCRTRLVTNLRIRTV